MSEEPKNMTPKRFIFIALLVVTILTPTLLLGQLVGWPYGLIYALGASLAAVVSGALANKE